MMMNSEGLINEVKKHECVYNVKHPDFVNTNLRYQHWNEISAKLGLEVEECKNSWYKLRHAHHEAIKRRLKKPYLPPWRYETQMGFLKRNISISPTQVKTEENNEKIQVVPPYKKRAISERCDTTENESDCENSSQSHHRYDPLTSSYSSDVKIEYTDEEQLKQDEIIHTASSSSTTSLRDHNDLFFYNMSQAMKKLPKHVQDELKVKFFKMAQDSEMRLYQLKSAVGLDNQNEECGENAADEIRDSQLNDAVKGLESNLNELGTYRSHLCEMLEKVEQSANNFVDSSDVNDQDRMFLLSLSSEFKQVPVASKMMLKAEIAMLLAKSMNT